MLVSGKINIFLFFFFSSRRRHTRCLSDWSSDVCSSDLMIRRPPRSTLDPHPHHESDRINLRHSALADCEDTRLRLARWHSGDGFQADEEGGTTLAQTERGRTPGPSDRWRAFQRRTTRGGSENRRLTSSIPNICKKLTKQD